MELIVGHRGLSRRGWFSSVRRLGSELGSMPAAQGLFTVGTSAHEPWHLTAHLQDAARWGNASFTAPTLARRVVPVGAPTHLAVGLDQVVKERPGCQLLVLAPDAPDAELLERLSDVRRRGGTVFALAGEADGASADLLQVAHDVAAVEDAEFDLAQHVLPTTLAHALEPQERRFYFARPSLGLGR